MFERPIVGLMGLVEEGNIVISVVVLRLNEVGTNLVFLLPVHGLFRIHKRGVLGLCTSKHCYFSVVN